MGKFVYGLTVGLTMFAVQIRAAYVVWVSVERIGSGIYCFDVAVKHVETGWGHYADNWHILSSTIGVMGTRDMHHTHVSDQSLVEILNAFKLVILSAQGMRVLTKLSS